MATTAAVNQPRTRQPRVSARAPRDVGHEHDYDLLTAALLGATLGAGITLMLRRGPSGQRPVSPIVRHIGKGAGWAGKRAMKLGTKSARWAAERGEDVWDRIPRDDIREHVSDYMTRAREAIDDAVASELNDLRRALRRQRKRLGV